MHDHDDTTKPTAPEAELTAPQAEAALEAQAEVEPAASEADGEPAAWAPPTPMPVQRSGLALAIQRSPGHADDLFTALEDQEGFQKARDAWHHAMQILSRRDDSAAIAALEEARVVSESFEALPDPLPTEGWALAELLQQLDDKTFARALRRLRDQVGNEEADWLYNAAMVEIERDERVTRALDEIVAGMVEMRRGLGRYSSAAAELEKMHPDYESGERAHYVAEMRRTLRVLELLEKVTGLDTTSYAAGVAAGSGR